MIINVTNVLSTGTRAYYNISSGYGNRTFQSASNFTANALEFAPFALQINVSSGLSSNNRLYVNAPHVDSGTGTTYNIIAIFCGALFNCLVDFSSASSAPALALFSRNGAYVERAPLASVSGDTPLYSQMTISNYTATGALPPCAAPLITSVSQLPNVQYWSFCYTLNSSANAVYGPWTVTASGIVTTAGVSSFYDSLTGGTDATIQQSGYVVVAVNGTRTWSGGLLNQYNTAAITNLNPVRGGYDNYAGNPDNVLLIGAPFVSGNGWSFTTAPAIVTGVNGGPFTTFHVSSTNKTLGESFLSAQVVESVLAPFLTAGVSAAQFTQTPPALNGVLFYDYLYGEIPGASSFTVAPLSQSVIATCAQSTASLIPYIVLTQPPVVNASVLAPLQCSTAMTSQTYQYASPLPSQFTFQNLTILSANLLYLSPVAVTDISTVASLALQVAVPLTGFAVGNSVVGGANIYYTMGIWTSQFVLLSQVSSYSNWVSPAQATTTLFTQLNATLSPAVTLSPGQYYVSFWFYTPTSHGAVVAVAYDASKVAVPSAVYTIIQGGSGINAGGVLYTPAGNTWITTSGQMNTGMIDVLDFGTGETYALGLAFIINAYACTNDSYTQATPNYSAPPVPSSSSAVSSSSSSALSSSPAITSSSVISSTSASAILSATSSLPASSGSSSLSAAQSSVLSSVLLPSSSSAITSSSSSSASSVAELSVSSSSSSSAARTSTTNSAVVRSGGGIGIGVIVACAALTLLVA